VGSRGMSLRQGQEGLGTKVPYVWEGNKALCSALIWLYRIACHLVKGLQNDSLGPSSMGGPKSFVLEAVPSGAGGTGTICMGGEQGPVLCSHLALQNCLSSCQVPPNTSSSFTELPVILSRASKMIL